MAEYEQQAFEKLKTVIAAARQNFPGEGRVRISTVGHDPSCFMEIESYVLQKFIKDELP